MPIYVFRKSLNISENKIDSSLFVQKQYWRTDYIESIIEEKIDMKIEIRSKNLTSPIQNADAACKLYADSGLKDPSIVWNTARVDLNGKKNW